MTNLVDSSGWLEYFADSERADLFAPAIEDTSNLIVPAVCVYEVFKKVLRERGENDALQVVSVMQLGKLVDLDFGLALEAAEYSLPFADSVIYAVAMRWQAVVWTQDMHFEGLHCVRFFPKQATA